MDKKSLHTLLGLEIDPSAPTFIIYTEKESSRLTYTAKFIFEHVLKANINFTTQISEFESSPFFKINYSSKNISNAFRVMPQAIMFEENVTKNKPVFFFKNDLIYFFETPQNSDIGYDVFSSVFYFISRYEEWQDFEPDEHGRFEAKASILYQHKMHLKPVVDVWIMELKNELRKFFKYIKFAENKFKVISTIDVDNLYAYKAKGFLRTIGAIFKDIFKSNLANLKHRIKVLRNKEKDPFDIYDDVSEFCSSKNIPLFVFFLFRTGNKYDRTVDPRSGVFAEVTERLKKRGAIIGLHPSYYSSKHKSVLQHEIVTFSKSSFLPIDLSRQHYLRFDIKTTPALLIEGGIMTDFTMGFASSPGFRAGTSFPFYYYNLNSNENNDLLMIPFCTMDGAYFVYDKISPDKMMTSLKDLAAEVKKVNGLFVSVFHERTFSNHLYPGYDRIYNNFHQTVNAL